MVDLTSYCTCTGCSQPPELCIEISILSDKERQYMCIRCSGAWCFVRLFFKHTCFSLQHVPPFFHASDKYVCAIILLSPLHVKTVLGTLGSLLGTSEIL